MTDRGVPETQAWERMPVKTPTILLDTDKMRILHISTAPGERTGLHTHEFDHLVVMFDAGQSRALLEGGIERVLQSAPRIHKINPAGIVHDVCNDSDHRMDFIEIEFKVPFGELSR
jgi:quercetin dioxygenase-like cupin family protein